MHRRESRASLRPGDDLALDFHGRIIALAEIGIQPASMLIGLPPPCTQPMKPGCRFPVE
jgi:hypothetical protein